MNYVIVGLGNPGEEYEGTRHNTGRMAVKEFAKKFKALQWKEEKKIKAQTAKVKTGKNSALLVLPDTYMNKSGHAVGPLVKSKKAAETLVVVHDDMDIPFGKIKISFNRSSGGHRGVESIIKAVGTEKFIRMRMGISPTNAKGIVKKPQGEKFVSDFILGKFETYEQDKLKKVMKVAADGLEILVKEGKDIAAGIINSRKSV